MLGRPLWPVLDEGQDPESLEARVAFHLHRLNLVGEPLRNTAILPDRHIALLSTARATLADRDIDELARRLCIHSTDLRRPLTDQETLEWRFYRVSARYPHEVWSRAKAAWEPHMTHSHAARLLGLPRQTLYLCIVDPPETPHTILSYKPALRLAADLGITPMDLIRGLEAQPEQSVSR